MSVKEEEAAGGAKKRDLMIHKVAVDLDTAKRVVERGKTKFFARLGFLKPRQEEIECESVELFYEPLVVAKADYFLDYYKKKTYTLEVGEEVSEVIAFDRVLKPEVVKEKGILKRPHKVIAFDAQERVIHKAATQMALNRTGREIDPAKLPLASIQPEPEETLKRISGKTRELKISPDIILDAIKERTAQRPPDVGKIAEEVFEVTEYALVYTPVFEARCRRLKTGEIKIFPISGVTGDMLSL